MAKGHRIVLVAFDDIPLFDLSTAAAVYGTDSTVAESLFELRIVSAEKRPIRVREGATVEPDAPLEALDDADTVIVPAFTPGSCSPSALEDVIAGLVRVHAAGARVVGFCGGVAVLAEAGLLDGRPATTHWFTAQGLRERYPKVRVDTRALFVDDGDVVTASGAMAGLDCCLALVAKDHGSAVARAMAQRMNAPMMRPADAPQYVEHPTPGGPVREELEPVLDWARDNITEAVDTETLVVRAKMSRRHFDRRFREITGTTPKQWLLDQRLTNARLMLETTGFSVEQVARRSGFRSALVMRSHFRSRFLVSPRDYRRRFTTRERHVAQDAFRSAWPAGAYAGPEGTSDLRSPH